jgi:hypothetical protein
MGPQLREKFFTGVPGNAWDPIQLLQQPLGFHALRNFPVKGLDLGIQKIELT